MDPHSILDKDSGDGRLPAEPPQREWPGTAGEGTPGEVRFPGEDGGRSLAGMAERDLSAALQLLAERAQYITGATGAAIALRDHEEMVCRASAGPSAPEVGAQLQVNSGLSGESVRTRQTLRCDDALTDERVNRESCEALGIRSVVVMPLLEGEDVIGVFELFSDKPNIFEARDLTALERMGAMVHTAVEHSAAALGLGPEAKEQAAAPPATEERAAESSSDAALSEPPPVETMPGSEAQSGAPMGRIEALAAARPGIAFHRRVPAADNAIPASRPASATPATVASVEVPSEATPATPGRAAEPIGADESAVTETLAVVKEDPDILEIGVETEAIGSEASVTGPAEEEVLAEENNPEVLPVPVPAALPDVAVGGVLGVSPLAVEETARVSVPLPSEADKAGSAVDPVVPEVASRGAIANLGKCEVCGFPVSEGRRLCLDCEKKKKVAGDARGSKGSSQQPTRRKQKFQGGCDGSSEGDSCERAVLVLNGGRGGGLVAGYAQADGGSDRGGGGGNCGGDAGSLGVEGLVPVRETAIGFSVRPSFSAGACPCHFLGA